MPLVGTWIEMEYAIYDHVLVRVVPLVGTWIEIGFGREPCCARGSCPSWARGLKSLTRGSSWPPGSRAPRGHVD